MSARDEHADDVGDSGDVGAGTGAAARDVGEEGTPAGAIGGTGGLADTDEECSALAGDAPSEEGAAAGGLRDENAADEDDEPL